MRKKALIILSLVVLVVLGKWLSASLLPEIITAKSHNALPVQSSDLSPRQKFPDQSMNAPVTASAETAPASEGRPRSDGDRPTTEALLFDADRISEESRGDQDDPRISQAAIDVWAKERYVFFIGPLQVDESELAELNLIERESAEEIEQLQEAYEGTPPLIDGEKYTEEFMRIDAEYNARCSEVLGPERAERAEAFRQKFNKALSRRFGLRNLHITRL